MQPPDSHIRHIRAIKVDYDIKVKLKMPQYSQKK